VALTRTWSQRERRYWLDRPTAERVLKTLVRRLPTITYVPGCADSLVVTAYLDTGDTHYLRLADASQGRRSVKLRIREYLSRPRPDAQYSYRDTCFLERKERVDELRIKQRIEMPKSAVSALIRGETRVQDAWPEAQAVGAELDALQLAPAMISAYDRRVFGTEEALRVTFDQRVAYYLPPPGLYDGVPALLPSVLGSAVARGPSRILEIKYPAESTMPRWLEQLVADVPPAHGFSKFRDGMHAVSMSDGDSVTLTERIDISKLEN
jgi:hypothetical protein